MTDPAFLLGLVIVVVASFMFAWEFGQQPLEVPKHWVRGPRVCTGLIRPTEECPLL
jgi:hypothetical protein